MISVIALPGEALVAGGATETVVISVGLLMLEHVSPAAERLLTEQTLVGLDTWKKSSCDDALKYSYIHTVSGIQKIPNSASSSFSSKMLLVLSTHQSVTGCGP